LSFDFILYILHISGDGASWLRHCATSRKFRGFDSRWCYWNFSFTSFRPHYVSGVDSASNRNEYQEYFLGGKGGRCVGLTTLPTSCADCLEIFVASTSWKPRGLSRHVQGLICFSLHISGLFLYNIRPNSCYSSLLSSSTYFISSSSILNLFLSF